MARPRRRRREARDPWTADPRDPLELLARLVGRTAQAPGMGRGGVLTDADLTGALGYMTDKVGAALAMSVAGRHAALLGYIVRRAHRRVLRSVAEARGLPVDLKDGADRYRLRGVLVDVTEALIWPERRRPMAIGAREAKMRTGAYCALYRHVEGVMAGVLADARRDFRVRMWADEVARRLQACSEASATTTFGVAVLRTDVEPWRPQVMRTGGSVETVAAEYRAMAWCWPQADDIADAILALPPVTPRRRQHADLVSHGQALLVLATAW